MKTRGFTLIELLVVIAIIGSLSAIVVGAITSGRQKAYDTKIKATLGNMRSQAALYYTDNSDYGVEISDGDCSVGMFTEPTFQSLLSSVDEANAEGDAVCYTSDSSGGSNSNTCAVSSSLRTEPSDSWCVDSDGVGEIATAQIVSDNAVCQ